jgi:hypothetical protein
VKTLKRRNEAVSRRRFIKTGVVVGTGVLAGTAACSSDSCDESEECSCTDPVLEANDCPDAGPATTEADTSSAAGNTTNANIEAGMLIEPEKKIPIMAEAEVIVVGGGPSGIAAALSSARNGAETILIDQYVWVIGAPGVRSSTWSITSTFSKT